MCNLYQLSPKGQVATHFRHQLAAAGWADVQADAAGAAGAANGSGATDGSGAAAAAAKDAERGLFALTSRRAPSLTTAPTVGPFGTGAFIRPADGALAWVTAQWGMIAPRAAARRPPSRSILTNNARVESVAERLTYRDAWRRGQRCLIPAAWYQEPNWETGKNIWWRMRRADGQPWMLAGIWSEWVDPATGEIVPNYAMLTCNCDGHPLLARLHKPDPHLPIDAQDKRAVAQIDDHHWEQWLHGSAAEALQLVQPQPSDVFDLTDALATDRLLSAARHF